MPPRNWHLTLRFLGDTPTHQRYRLVRELKCTHFGEPFLVRFGGLGAFPHARRAGVLWLGVTAGAEELNALATAAEGAVRRAGLAFADRPFRPHLTLSRIHPLRSVTALLDSAPPCEVAIQVHEWVLCRSHLGGGPARYEAVARLPLG